MTRKTWLASVVALVAVLSAGGCTLDDDDTPAGAATAKRSEPTITIAWGADPLSVPRPLDPAFATDRTSENVLLNVMDPLVKLDENLRPQPHLAEKWEASDDARTFRFTLRRDARWTNGDPVTAEDFEYSWKRTLSPELNAPNADRLFGIAGAPAYHACEASGCTALADAVGVKALNRYTLEVRLWSPRPWFPAEVAHPAFLAVHPSSVEGFGDGVADPENVVSNGPFAVAGWEPGRSLTLAKSAGWRAAGAVAVGRVDGRIIEDETARVQAFDAGDVMVLDASGLPASDMPALRERAEYERYPALATYYYGFNLQTIPDVHQRRAMSLAIDRRALVEHVGRADELPAIGFTPPGAPGFDEILAASPWVSEKADMNAAKAELERATDVKTKVNLFYRDAPGNREIAEAVRDRWQELGIETRIRGKEGAEYLGFLRPPNTGVDVYQVGWRYDFADPVNGLQIWACGSEENYSNFCSRAFDAIIRRTSRERNVDARNALYAAAEEALFGTEGELPLTPVYWYTFPNLEALKVRETFEVDPLGHIDLAAVVVE